MQFFSQFMVWFVKNQNLKIAKTQRCDIMNKADMCGSSVNYITCQFFIWGMHVVLYLLLFVISFIYFALSTYQHCVCKYSVISALYISLNVTINITD